MSSRVNIAAFCRDRPRRITARPDGPNVQHATALWNARCNADGSIVKPSRVSPSPAIVLLVEASVDDRAMYAAYLRRHGFTPVEVSTTDEALVACPGASLMIVNLTTPGVLTALELIRRIRTTAAIDATPVVVLSSAVFETDRKAARDAGCDHFLSKPCEPDSLLRVVRRWMKRGAQRK